MPTWKASVTGCFTWFTYPPRSYVCVPGYEWGAGACGMSRRGKGLTLAQPAAVSKSISKENGS